MSPFPSITLLGVSPTEKPATEFRGFSAILISYNIFIKILYAANMVNNILYVIGFAELGVTLSSNEGGVMILPAL